MRYSEHIETHLQENQVFHRKSKELARILDEAIKKKEITLYTNDSLKTVMSLPNYEENSLIIDDTDSISISNSRGKNLDNYFKTTIRYSYMSKDSVYYRIIRIVPIEQINEFEITYQISFDSKGNKKIVTPKVLTLVLPAKYNETKGINMQVTSFKYEDVVRLLRKDERANFIDKEGKKRNYADLLDNREFIGLQFNFNSQISYDLERKE